MTLRDWFWIVLLGAIWGCSFLFNAILIREIGPMWVSAGRVSVGALGCWAYFAATRRTWPRERGLYGRFLILGIINYAAPFALFPLAEQHLASGIVGVINAMTPMTTVIVSQFWPGGEKATWNKSTGVAIGLAGCAILAAPTLGAGQSAELWAVGAALLATLCYAITLNYARGFSKLDPATTAAGSLTGAAIAAIPLAFLTEGVPVMVRPESWAAMLGIGLISTSFSFLLMYKLLPRIGGTNFSITTFIAPISAIALGVAVLGEKLSSLEVLGVLVIFLGLIAMDGRLLRWVRAQMA
ncbi:MAG TPA: DMT family transporter [Devosiaceae bacterium]|nr:DMT family transporter [Devosiaceae bacterium]